MGDYELLQKIRNGDQEAYGNMVEQYGKYVSAVVNKVGQGALNKWDVEEVSSDVFVAIWENRERVKLIGESIRPYLGVVARNKAINRLKSSRYNALHKGLEETDQLNPIELSPEEELIQQENRESINDVLECMEQPDREIFIRRYFYCEKVSEIAGRLGLNENTVMVKLFRGRKKLEKLLVKRGIS